MNLDQFAGSVSDFIQAMTGQQHNDQQVETYTQQISITEEER
ncbi:hypothetical protein [Brevibacterium casei]|nr:hypothetical protein [Brevibacterium casei]